MKKLYFKHTGLPVPDLFLQYEIDESSRLVRINLEDHFDSALFIDFARRVLEQEEGIRVIDNESVKTFGPAQIKGRFDIELLFADMIFDVKILQLGAWMQSPGTAPTFTLSIQKNHKQSSLAKSHEAAYAQLNDEFDLPHTDLSWLIRRAQTSGGTLPENARKRYSYLPAELLNRIETVVRETLGPSQS